MHIGRDPVISDSLCAASSSVLASFSVRARRRAGMPHARGLAALSTALGLAAGAAAWAQSADQTTAQNPAAQATPAAGGSGLQEVVVTAQFRQENVQQTPLAITAINANALAERGQTSLTQITQDAPSVSLAPETGAFGPSMAAFIRASDRPTSIRPSSRASASTSTMSISGRSPDR